MVIWNDQRCIQRILLDVVSFLSVWLLGSGVIVVSLGHVDPFNDHMFFMGLVTRKGISRSI